MYIILASYSLIIIINIYIRKSIKENYYNIILIRELSTEHCQQCVMFTMAPAAVRSDPDRLSTQEFIDQLKITTSYYSACFFTLQLQYIRTYVSLRITIITVVDRYVHTYISIIIISTHNWTIKLRIYVATQLVFYICDPA